MLTSKILLENKSILVDNNLFNYKLDVLNKLYIIDIADNIICLSTSLKVKMIDLSELICNIGDIYIEYDHIFYNDLYEQHFITLDKSDINYSEFIEPFRLTQEYISDQIYKRDVDLSILLNDPKYLLDLIKDFEII